MFCFFCFVFFCCWECKLWNYILGCFFFPAKICSGPICPPLGKFMLTTFADLLCRSCEEQFDLNNLVKQCHRRLPHSRNNTAETFSTPNVLRVLCVQGAMILRAYTLRVLCSTVLCSQGPLFSGSCAISPMVLCSHGPILSWSWYS